MFSPGKILTIVLLLCGTQLVTASELLPYEAVYRTKVNGFNVNVQRRVQVQESRVSVSNDAKRFLFGFHESAVLVESSEGVLMAETYDHKRRGLSHKHDKELVFSWTEDTVRDLLKPKRPPLPVGRPTYDKLSYQTQMRLDLLREPDLQHLEYCVTNGVRNRIYSLERLGEEILDTPLGKLRTMKWQREGDDDDRQVFVWFAPDWNFLVVRIDQTKVSGGRTERLILRSAKIAGTSVQGLPN
jgi:hypothetical protein